MACGVFGFGLTPECVAAAAIAVLAFVGGLLLLFLAVWFVYKGNQAAAIVASLAAVFLLTGPFGVAFELVVLAAFYLARQGSPVAAGGVLVVGLVVLLSFGAF